MKLDSLPNARNALPLIRIYDFTGDEIAQLALAIQNLAAEREQQLELHSMKGVYAIDQCQLTLRVTDHDQAMICIKRATFECGFTPGTWDNVAGLLQPFTDDADGYQWLAEAPGEAYWLVSLTGGW